MGILIENDFEVPAPVDTVWNYVLDVERIAPCMPGATLTEAIDEDNFKGKVTIKLGPVSLSFAGTVTVVERDAGEHRVEIKASGMEQRGKGSATALITAWVEPAGATTTKVRFKQDITVSGAVAQFSRGMMQDVSAKLTKQFADCLKTNITAEQEALTAAAPAGEQPDASEASSTVTGSAPEGGTASGSTSGPAAGGVPAANAATPRPAPVATAKSIGGIRLGLWAFWRAIVRFFQRLFGRTPKD
ncbi:MAG TPA: SRPBCC family protein [Actinomycetota bacterium]|jgi:carbon monoxide dehydrogenase subunit G